MTTAVNIMLMLAPLIIGGAYTSGAWHTITDGAARAPYELSTANMPPEQAAAALDMGPVDIRGTIHDDTNAARAQHGLPTLHRDPRLDAIAQAHAEDMIARDYYLHDTPEGIDPSGRATRAGYDCRKDHGVYYTTGIGENIMTWTGISAAYVASDAVPVWMESPGHRENILDPNYDRLGVGVAAGRGSTFYAVQNFC